MLFRSLSCSAFCWYFLIGGLWYAKPVILGTHVAEFFLDKHFNARAWWCSKIDLEIFVNVGYTYLSGLEKPIFKEWISLSIE